MAASRTSFADKVAQAQADLSADDLPDTRSTLNAFVSEVNAQSGKSIQPARAAALIADANQIRNVLGC